MVKKNGGQPHKKAAQINILLLIALLVLLNLISQFVFQRFDLTIEKRFTLSKSTRELVKSLNDIVYFKVYLDGNMPASYRRLREETRIMLNEFRAHNSDVQYEFIDPSASPSEKERNQVYSELYKAGLNYATPTEKKKGEVSKQILFPGAIVSYRGRQMALQLLKNKTYANENELINRSINDLEYELSNIIRKITQYDKPDIAFLQGHGELDTLQTKDAALALQEYYAVHYISLDSNITRLLKREKKNDSIIISPRYKAIIVAKPSETFNGKDKFILDQYLMYGGKIFWLIDPLVADMDSIAVQPSAMAFPYELNLDDQFFKYGFRINPQLVMDLRSASVPVVTGQIGNQPKMNFFKWFYFPLAFPHSNHPIINHLNAVKFEFVSSIDTVFAGGKLKKTILLQSSEKSALTGSLPRYTLNLLRQKPSPDDFPKQNIPLALLLEGEFESNFTKRISPEIEKSSLIGFKESSKPTAMVVVADGDIIRNHVKKSDGSIYPMGYDRYTRELFGNRDFIVNTVNYLCDDAGLISVRSRSVQLRLLDEEKINQKIWLLQMQNVALPLGIVWLTGLGIMIYRKKIYGQKTS